MIKVLECAQEQVYHLDIIPKRNSHQKFRIPKMELPYLIYGYFAGGFSLRTYLNTASYSETSSIEGTRIVWWCRLIHLKVCLQVRPPFHLKTALLLGLFHHKLVREHCGTCPWYLIEPLVCWDYSGRPTKLAGFWTSNRYTLAWPKDMINYLICYWQSCFWQESRHLNIHHCGRYPSRKQPY